MGRKKLAEKMETNSIVEWQDRYYSNSARSVFLNESDAYTWNKTLVENTVRDVNIVYLNHQNKHGLNIMYVGHWIESR